MAIGRAMSLSPIRAQLQFLMGPREHVYAVVDAARDNELAVAARSRFGLRLHTLFEGELAQYLDHAAPHLIPVRLDCEYVELWAEHLGRSAGILLLTNADTDALRAHLRRMFVVTDEHGEEYFFRFYDPRVLRVYLPTCTVEEGHDFFGPIRRILVESERPGMILRYEVDHRGVKGVEGPLRTAPSDATTRGGRA